MILLWFYRIQVSQYTRTAKHPNRFLTTVAPAGARSSHSVPHPSVPHLRCGWRHDGVPQGSRPIIGNALHAKAIYRPTAFHDLTGLARLRLRPTRHVASQTKLDPFAPGLGSYALLVEP